MQLGFSAEGLKTDSSINQWHNKVELHAARKAAIVTAAKAPGRKSGRSKSLSAEKHKMAMKLYWEANHTVQEICGLVGVSKPTLYSYVRQSA